MPKVIFCYNNCTGEALCTEKCPVDVLTGSENRRWCKPVDEEVENKKELDIYYKEVDREEDSDLELEFIIPSCIACNVCRTVCPEGAIEIIP